MLLASTKFIIINHALRRVDIISRNLVFAILLLHCNKIMFFCLDFLVMLKSIVIILQTEMNITKVALVVTITGMFLFSIGINSVFAASSKNLIGVPHFCRPDKFEKWRNPDGSLKSTVTFRIVETGGASNSFVQAVKAGLREWSGFVYNVQEVGSSEDISVRIKDAAWVGPNSPRVRNAGIVTGDQDCSGENPRRTHADLTLAKTSHFMRNSVGVHNLAAHEMGHALGLGPMHATSKGDIMHTVESLTAKELNRHYREFLDHVICPSNLDVGGLTAEVDPFSVNTWRELSCNK